MKEMIKKIVHTLITKKITIAKWQLSFFGIICIFTGLMIGSYLTVKKIFISQIKASESSSITYDTATDFNIGSTSTVVVSGIGTSAALRLSGNDTPPIWWDNNYGYRKKITINNNVDKSLPQGYSVNYAFDHTLLVNQNKSLSSGDDIRIVYWNGVINVELDRVLDENSTWNNSATKIWFKTQSSLDALESDENYYLYYNYSSASSPPTNKNNVYALWDDFNEHSNGTDPDGWREDAGT